MSIIPTDEQMIIDLQFAGESFEKCPLLKDGATQGEKEIHKAMVNNWKTKLFIRWQTVCALKSSAVSKKPDAL